jgi:hypothetical protein
MRRRGFLVWSFTALLAALLSRFTGRRPATPETATLREARFWRRLS